MNFGAFTDVGKVRKENEDSLYIPDIDNNVILFLVSDGIGGKNYGELASKMTVQNIAEYIKEQYEKAEDKTSLLKDAAIYANAKIYDLANENEEYNGMGATLVALLIDGNKINITHAGDSRCYMIRNGIISQLTIDNSYVEYLLQKGAINAEEAKNHPQKNLITKAVGMEQNIEIDIESVIARPNDIFLLCSDGLTTMLSDEEILHIILNKKSNMQDLAKELVSYAKDKGGYDNITAILVEV
jgi:protein phosphatase